MAEADPITTTKLNGITHQDLNRKAKTHSSQRRRFKCIALTVK